MSELPELPPATPLRRPLPADGLERAVAAGRRRRARFAGGTAGGGLLTAVVVAALLASPSGEPESLRFASPEPEPAASGRALASAEPDARTEPSGEPATDPSGPPDASAPPAAEGGTSGPPGAAPAQPPPGGQAGPPPDQRPAYREVTDEDAAGNEFCTPTKVTTGGCAYGDDNGPVVRRGTAVTAASGYCAGADSAGATVFEFSGGQETELVVRQGEREVFRFSSTVRYVDGAHERRLRGGRCLEFRQVWSGVDTAGEPVPAGDYRVVLTVHPSGVRYDFADGTSVRDQAQANGHEFDVTLVD